MKKPILLAQGTYGCVYYPGLKCNAKTETKRFVSKVQLKGQDMIQEEEIGKIIKTIPQYSLFFAPVLNACPLQMASIERGELEKCELFNKNGDKEYMLTKVRYVGKSTLKPYLLETISANPVVFLTKVVQTHLILLKALQKLAEKNIVHFDLKENNILVQDKIERPIIIDFGLSFVLLNTLSIEQLKFHFFTYYEKYAPWCIEIVLISYLLRVESENLWHGSKEKIRVFLNENPVNMNMSGKSKEKIMRYWSRFFKEKVGKSTIISKLLTSWKTWDTYSINVIFYRIMNSVVTTRTGFVEDYLSMLETSLFSPTKPNPDEFYTMLESLSIAPEEVKKIEKDLNQNVWKEDDETERKVYNERNKFNIF